ncbi:hypothetical protein P3795_30725 [Pseudomonas aeruginosa]|nr:hypothetical protein [Pseudomonas aeruginosa]KSO41668.1 hypothetical protein APB05_16735 [Pseudomonas aeruginosa]MBG7134436.1 hypothetical protein [Pseudomonas aeruginosa]MCS7779177.1 hypothetical protein [Pseudomonas aeruginosa]MDP5479077.1 hypothetical protein [Pseudomonas aeruginosa]MDP5521232.1 hypothetical protein [Pseudomonas aeruginosa]
MSNIRNVQWNEGAPKQLEPGMVIRSASYEGVFLIGAVDAAGESSLATPLTRKELDEDQRSAVIAWAWLIKPHELAWLEDMASKHKARARG